MTQSAQAAAHPYVIARELLHCIDCPAAISEDQRDHQFGRCNACACSKYGVPERRQTEFKQRAEP